MSLTFTMRTDAQSMICATAVCGLASRTDAPTLLPILAEEVVVRGARTLLQVEADLVASEADLARLFTELNAAEPDFDEAVRQLVRSVTLPGGLQAHAVNRECFGGASMHEVLRSRRELKLMTTSLYLRNLALRREVRWDAELLPKVRAALERLQAAHTGHHGVESRLLSLRAERRTALDTFNADYKRFVAAGRALWGVRELQQWLPAFWREEVRSAEDEPTAAEVAPAAAMVAPTAATVASAAATVAPTAPAVAPAAPAVAPAVATVASSAAAATAAATVGSSVAAAPAAAATAPDAAAAAPAAATVGSELAVELAVESAAAPAGGEVSATT